jgi:integrase
MGSLIFFHREGLMRVSKVRWIASLGLSPSFCGGHLLRRTKATLIYRRTPNLRAIRLLLGHTKVETSVRYLDTEVDAALNTAEEFDV